MSRGATTLSRLWRGALWLLLFATAGLAGYGQVLTRYEETVTLAADGTAAIRIVLEPRGAGGLPVLIPAGPKTVRDLKVTGIAAAALRQVEKGGERYLELDLPPVLGAAKPIKVEYATDGYFKAGGRPGPFGNRPLRYRFVNVSFAAIDHFAATIALPEGHVFNAVSRFVPEPEKEGMVAPFAIVRAGGRIIGRITLPRLGLGQEVALACTFRAARRSKLMLVVLAILALAYLAFFRDLLKNGKKATAAKP
jgi:hypothetical protein